MLNFKGTNRPASSVLAWDSSFHGIFLENKTLVFLFCIISTQPRASWPPTLFLDALSPVSCPLFCLFLLSLDHFASHCPHIFVPGASFGLCQGSVLPWLCLSLPVVWSIAPRPWLGLSLSVLDFRELNSYLPPILFPFGHRTEFTNHFLSRPLDREASLESLGWVSVALGQRRNYLSVVLLGGCKDSRTIKRASHEF